MLADASANTRAISPWISTSVGSFFILSPVRTDLRLGFGLLSKAYPYTAEGGALLTCERRCKGTGLVRSPTDRLVVHVLIETHPAAGSIPLRIYSLQGLWPGKIGSLLRKRMYLRDREFQHRPFCQLVADPNTLYKELYGSASS